VPASRSELGSLLLGDAARSHLYVKRIFVKNEAVGAPFNLSFGYDVPQAGLNRDRDAVLNLWERHRSTSRLVADVANNLPRLRDNPEYAEHPLGTLIQQLFHALRVNDHTLYYFHETSNPDVNDELFQFWWQYVEGTPDHQPVHPNQETIVLKKINDMGVGSEFYKFSARLSGQLWNCVCRSRHYETFDARVQHVLRGAQGYAATLENERADHDTAVQVLGRLNMYPDRTRIHFKEFGYKLHYIETGADGGKDAYLSRHVLNEDQIRDQDPAIQVPRKVAAKIFISVAQLLGLRFEHMLVNQCEEFRREMPVPQTAGYLVPVNSDTDASWEAVGGDAGEAPHPGTVG